MSDDPGSLANLRDLVLPPDIPFWPPAPGLWIVAATCLAMLAVPAWRAVQRYRAAAYRRAAIAQLHTKSAGIEQNQPDAEAPISAVIKRVAMVEYGRDKIASLSGPAWADFVAHEAGTGFDPATIHRLLTEAFDGRTKPDPSELRLLIGHAELWVRAHRTPTVAEA